MDQSTDFQVNAVREAFRLVYPGAALTVEGVEVESGVSCQVGACVHARVYVGGCSVSSRLQLLPAHPPTIARHGTLQPFSDLETYRGALTRARNAAAAWEGRSGERRVDFAVGLVGGTSSSLWRLLCMCVCVFLWCVCSRALDRLTLIHFLYLDCRRAASRRRRCCCPHCPAPVMGVQGQQRSGQC